ncbi:Vacuolar iron transporter-like protein 4 [Bienertia sinuspersici]
MTTTWFIGMIAGVYATTVTKFLLAYLERNAKNPNVTNPNPFLVVLTSGIAYLIGALIPFLASFFIRPYRVKLRVVVSTATIIVAILGWFGVFL